ncbi:MAG: class I SAM-dependent RNA methyltransferase [Geminicoccaceae bacterium]|nr:class I SAM-dependent RNA methyltransferase [Geminicoccaceae bacterium]
MPPPTTLRAGAQIEVGIEGLGFMGDGIAPVGGARVAVPLALPGERWRVRLEGETKGLWRATPLVCLAPAPERQVPPCPHFGACGGCRLQHLPGDAYAALKRRRITGALRARRINAPEPLPTARSPLGSRRRLRLALDEDMRPGFRRPRSNEAIAVDVCPITRPELVARLAPLGQALAGLDRLKPGDEAEIALVGGGVDLLLLTKASPSDGDRRRLIRLAEAADLDRIALRWPGGAEIAVGRRPLRLVIGAAAVEPPPGAFLQATAEGASALTAFADAHLPRGAAVLDLFAGLGTFALALARNGRRLHAVEADPAMTAALEAAARAAGLPVTAEVRDLHRRPLPPAALDRHDAVLLDPPRAGAEAQAKALADSRVARVVYASCDPATFARDAAPLVRAGFRLEALLPVDQFLYAAEIELIAAFARAPTAIKGA